MNKKQIIFITFTLSFAVLLSLVLLLTDTDGGSADGTSSLASLLPIINESSEEPDESSEAPGDDSSAEEPSNTSDDSSAEEPIEESREPIPPNELPYDQNDLMALRPRDMVQNDIDGYFENSVFIGNSLMMDFYNYCTARRREVPNFFGKAKFFCSYGYSAYIDLHDDTTVWPRYQGEALHSWEAVSKMDVDTVYYCLMGLTEIWKYSYNTSPEKTFESNRQVLEKIKEARPDCKIVLLSCSYMVDSFNRSDRALNNYLISRFNAIALEWADQNGCDFIDISTPFLVGDAIAVEYCRDPDEKGQGCHIKNDYYSAWAAVLRNYAYQSVFGAWQNPDEMRILNAHR